MTRLLACVAAAVVVAGCGFAAAPQKSDAAVLVGIGDQDASMFTNPLFEKAGFKRARYFPSWDVALQGARAGGAVARRSGSTGAQATGTEPLISFFASLGSACPKRPCKLPTVRQYTKAFKAFQKRWPEVKVISPWNEANHRSQPTFKNPKRAAQYYNVVAQVLQGLQDRRGGRDRREEHGALAQGLQEDRQEAAHLGPPQLPRHEQAQGPAARRHEAAAEGGEGRRLAHRDRRHREVRAAERRTRCSRSRRAGRTARPSGCSRSRSATGRASSGCTSTTSCSPRRTTASTPG